MLNDEATDIRSLQFAKIKGVSGKFVHLLMDLNGEREDALPFSAALFVFLGGEATGSCEVTV